MKEKSLIIWVDEAGRGAWAGPVVAGACVFVSQRPKFYRELNDSKKLSPQKRERLFDEIISAAKWWKIIYEVGIVDSTIIDRVGIREANKLAMEQAMKGIFAQIPPDQIWKIQIDGRDNYRFHGIDPEMIEYIVRWDSFIKEIQAASIIAKVTRDRAMREYAEQFPNYGFEQHKGYGTRLHAHCLEAHWPILIHRQSYTPIKNLILKRESI